jgi:RHS repeat-associated protein
LDYFGARYFSGAQGRFSSADRMNVTDDRLLSPSSTLNKYTYAANNPMRFQDPDGRDQSAMMSFGPNDRSAGTRAIEVFGGPVGSTTRFEWPASADDLRRNYTALSIQTTPEQAQDVINFINRFQITENPYALYQTNCTTVCRDAMKAIGILPRDFGAITPWGLWSYVWGNFSRARKEWDPWLKRVAPEATFDMAPGRTPGVDYGLPRFGMNTFDFIMLMLKEPKGCVEVADSASGTRSKQCE